MLPACRLLPFFGYPSLGLGCQNQKLGYPKERVWYEPTGTDTLHAMSRHPARSVLLIQCSLRHLLGLSFRVVSLEIKPSAYRT